MPTANRYSPVVDALLALPRTPALDAGTPDRAAGAQLTALDAAALFAPAPVQDSDAARACLCGLWLWFDCLDESHTLSQTIRTPEGSFWHGILHRREGDYGNAKYWFRRVGPHPVYGPLRAAAAQLAKGATRAPKWLAARTWGPDAVVGFGEAVV